MQLAALGDSSGGGHDVTKSLSEGRQNLEEAHDLLDARLVESLYYENVIQSEIIIFFQETLL